MLNKNFESFCLCSNIIPFSRNVQKICLLAMTQICDCPSVGLQGTTAGMRGCNINITTHHKISTENVRPDSSVQTTRSGSIISCVLRLIPFYEQVSIRALEREAKRIGSRILT
jgi:hypothetical protein